MFHRRVIQVCLAATVLGELIIFLVWGLWLHPGGNVVNKFLWTVVFCGFGMGSSVAVLLILSVVDKLTGWKAAWAASTITFGILGVLCNWLCFRLDSRYFHYFGGAESPTLFIASGILMSTLGGLLIGWLLFVPSGQRVLRRIWPGNNNRAVTL